METVILFVPSRSNAVPVPTLRLWTNGHDYYVDEENIENDPVTQARYKAPTFARALEIVCTLMQVHNGSYTVGEH